MSKSRGSIRRRLFIAGLILTGVASMGLHLNQSSEPAPAYRTDRAKRETLVRQVSAGGQVVPATRADVGSPIAGVVSEVLVRNDSRVKAGQPLMRLDAAAHRAALEESRISLANARTALDLATRRADQARELLAGGLISKSEYDRAVGEMKQIEGSVKIARSAVARLAIDLDRCTIRSPLDGVVIARNVEPGQVVSAGTGVPPLFVIAQDLRSMRVEANVSEADVGSVAPDQEVAFTVDAFPERRFRGRVSAVGTLAVVDQNVVTYPATIDVDNESLELKPGMTANVSITVMEREEVISVANKALRFRPEGAKKEREHDPDPGDTKASDGAPRAVVYRLVERDAPEGKRTEAVEPVTIVLGPTDGRRTEVTEGLEEGDRIVVGIEKSKQKEKGFLARIPDLLSGKDED